MNQSPVFGKLSVVHMHVILAHVKKVLCERQRNEMYVKRSLAFQEERALQITRVPSVKGGGREKWMGPVFIIRCHGVLLPQELCPDLKPCQPERARPLPSGWGCAVSAQNLPTWPRPYPPHWPPLWLPTQTPVSRFQRIKISPLKGQRQLQAVWLALCLPPPLPNSRWG